MRVHLVRLIDIKLIRNEVRARNDRLVLVIEHLNCFLTFFVHLLTILVLVDQLCVILHLVHAMDVALEHVRVNLLVAVRATSNDHIIDLARLSDFLAFTFLFLGHCFVDNDLRLMASGIQRSFKLLLLHLLLHSLHGNKLLLSHTFLIGIRLSQSREEIVKHHALSGLTRLMSALPSLLCLLLNILTTHLLIRLFALARASRV